MLESLRWWKSARRRTKRHDVFEAHVAVARLTVRGEPEVDLKTLEPALPQPDLVGITCGC